VDVFAGIDAIRPTKKIMSNSGGAQTKLMGPEKRKYEQEYDGEEGSNRPQKKTKLDAPQLTTVYPAAKQVTEPAFAMPSPYPAPSNAAFRAAADTRFTYPSIDSNTFRLNTTMGEQQSTSPNFRPYLASKAAAMRPVIAKPVATKEVTTPIAVNHTPTRAAAIRYKLPQQYSAQTGQTRSNSDTTTGNQAVQTLPATPSATAVSLQPLNALTSTNPATLNANMRPASLPGGMAAAERELHDWKPLLDLEFDTVSSTGTSDRLFRTLTPEITEEEFWGDLYRAPWVGPNIDGGEKRGLGMVFSSLMDAAWSREMAGWR
jgi:hypothetical protein